MSSRLVRLNLLRIGRLRFGHGQRLLFTNACRRRCLIAAGQVRFVEELSEQYEVAEIHGDRQLYVDGRYVAR